MRVAGLMREFKDQNALLSIIFKVIEIIKIKIFSKCVSVQYCRAITGKPLAIIRDITIIN